MSTSCIITKKGLKTVRWNGDLKKDEIFDCKNPLLHINHQCEIEKGVTLKDIMKIGQDKLMSKIISVYSDVNDIDGFHRELKKPNKRKRLGFTYLEIYRTGNIFDDVLNFYVDFHGVKAKERCEYCDNPKYPNHGHYVGLDFTPLNEIANAEVRLNKKFIITQGYDKVVLDAECEFTLMDVLHAIYYEISFFGGPKDRERQKKALIKTVKNIKSGKEKLVPFEDVFND